MKPLSKDERLKELREEVREYGSTGWHGADAPTLKTLAEVIDDRAELLAACEMVIEALKDHVLIQALPELAPTVGRKIVSQLNSAIKNAREDR